MACGCSRIRKADIEKRKEEDKALLKNPFLDKNVLTCSWCPGVMRTFPSGDLRCTSCGNKKIIL